MIGNIQDITFYCKGATRTQLLEIPFDVHEVARKVPQGDYADVSPGNFRTQGW